MAAAETYVVSDGFFVRSLATADPEVFAAVDQELHRQQNEIELIASENIVSRAVLEAAGTVLTNKYAEGYPGRRYYGGCQYVDIAENLAIERAKQLFGCSYANVQPSSGSQANQAVFLALLQSSLQLRCRFQRFVFFQSLLLFPIFFQVSSFTIRCIIFSLSIYTRVFFLRKTIVSLASILFIQLNDF